MTSITIRGNTTGPVELRWTQNGKAVATVTVAENVGKDDKKRTNFHRVTLWGELGEHAANLDKGTSVIVVGRLDQNEYTDKDQNKRTSWDVTADAFGPDIRFQTVVVTKASAGGQSRGQADTWTQPAQAPAASWDTAQVGGAPSYGDAEPF